MIDQPNLVYAALKMLGILIVLLGGLYACLHLIKRLLHTGITGKQDPLIRVVNVRSVGIKKQIALIAVPGAVLVIGMSGDRMQLLDKIVDPDILARISSEPVSAVRGQRTVSQ